MSYLLKKIYVTSPKQVYNRPKNEFSSELVTHISSLVEANKEANVWAYAI